jgi:hypothetical protein
MTEELISEKTRLLREAERYEALSRRYAEAAKKCRELAFLFASSSSSSSNVETSPKSETNPSEKRLSWGEPKRRIVRYFLDSNNLARSRRDIQSGTGLSQATVYSQCSKREGGYLEQLPDELFRLTEAELTKQRKINN